MIELKRVSRGAFVALTALSLGACAGVSHNYDPDEKFANFVPTQSVQLTGSRIPVQIDPNDGTQHIETMMPISIMNRDFIDQTGETTLRGVLRRTVPNMITTGPRNR